MRVSPRLRFSVMGLIFMVSGWLVSEALAAPSCHELKRRWYETYAKEMKVSWKVKDFSCHRKRAKRADEGILALAFFDLHFSQFKKLPGQKTPNFYRLVSTRISKLEYDAKCDDGVLASALGSVVTLCDAYFSEPREDRASTLVHEARHTEEDDSDHEPCKGGRYKGEEQGCDQKFFNGAWQGSGYNADVYFYFWNLKRSAKKNELSKSVMQSMINAMVPDRFNEISPKAIKEWRK